MPNIGEYQVSEDVARLNKDVLGEFDPEKKPRKYLNTPTIYKGRQYDSVKEASRARDLDLLKQAGEVVAWFAQVSFDLPGSRYVADFVVIDKNWQVHVEDVKAWDAKSQKFRLTPEFKIKAKLFKAKYGIDIEEM